MKTNRSKSVVDRNFSIISYGHLGWHTVEISRQYTLLQNKRLLKIVCFFIWMGHRWPWVKFVPFVWRRGSSSKAYFDTKTVNDEARSSWSLNFLIDGIFSSMRYHLYVSVNSIHTFSLIQEEITNWLESVVDRNISVISYGHLGRQTVKISCQQEKLSTGNLLNKISSHLS